MTDDVLLPGVETLAAATTAGDLSARELTEADERDEARADGQVPGFGSDGLPLSVQLVSRGHDETPILAVAAQLEQPRPWADHRPPNS